MITSDDISILFHLTFMADIVKGNQGSSLNVVTLIHLSVFLSLTSMHYEGCFHFTFRETSLKKRLQFQNFQLMSEMRMVRQLLMKGKSE